ncbi:ATP-dependent DNA helicase Q4, partial [Linderina pennispora]
MYKRMVAGKNRRERAAAAKEKAAADDDAEHPEEDEFDGAFDEELSSEAENADPVPVGEIESQDHWATRMVAGKPLSFFAADDSSVDKNPCTVSEKFIDGHDVTVDTLKVLKHVWGHDQFRFGQAEAIRRILGCRSTLLLLATGSGKSLAYQLPSLLLSSLCNGLTLVVTPLISLMRDQIKHLPKEFQAICMSLESADASGYSSVLQRLASGQVQLMFVSPERLASPRFHDLM